MICDRCLCHFKYQKSYDNHKKDCENINECRVILPGKNDKILKFKNYKNKEKVPFAVYADIESLLEPVTNTTAYQKHIPTSVAFYLHCNFNESLSEFKLYRGADCINWFMN